MDGEVEGNGEDQSRQRTRDEEMDGGGEGMRKDEEGKEEEARKPQDTRPR